MKKIYDYIKREENEHHIDKRKYMWSHKLFVKVNKMNLELKH